MVTRNFWITIKNVFPFLVQEIHVGVSAKITWQKIDIRCKRRGLYWPNFGILSLIYDIDRWGDSAGSPYDIYALGI